MKLPRVVPRPISTRRFKPTEGYAKVTHPVMGRDDVDIKREGEPVALEQPPWWKRWVAAVGRALK